MGTRKIFHENVVADAPSDTVAIDLPRRHWLTGGAALLGFAGCAWAQAGRSGATGPKSTLRQYANSILADDRGWPLKVSSLRPLTNYVFHYPFVATPCLLLDMGRAVGGVGPRRSLVAFSAICSHKLAYPAREVSFIRFQAKASTHSAAERIHCCADHSVYDPAQQAAVVAGPAPDALAAVELAYDASADTVTAVGIRGAEQFDAFFAKYDFKLAMEFSGKARQPSGAHVRVQELTQFCRNVAQC